MRMVLNLTGTKEASLTTQKLAVSRVGTADYEALDAAIQSEPRSRNDSRIAKVTIDGGPGTISHLYCLEGIRGQIKYEATSDGASLNVHSSHPGGNAIVFYDNSGFDGRFRLSHGAQQLILSVVPTNPATTIQIDNPRRNPDLPSNHITLSPTEDTHVTVEATSQDRTQKSSIRIVIDKALCPTNHNKPV